MIRIIQNQQNNYDGLFIVMKSNFMPPNSSIIFLNKEVNLPFNQWKAIDDFTSTLQNHELIERIYP